MKPVHGLEPLGCDVPYGCVGVLFVAADFPRGKFALLDASDIEATLAEHDQTAAAEDVDARDLAVGVIQATLVDFGGGGEAEILADAVCWALCRLPDDPGNKVEATLLAVIERDGAALITGTAGGHGVGAGEILVTVEPPKVASITH